MKLNFTKTLVMLSAVVLFYASCKKESKPAVSTTTKTAVDYKALSSQIALNFYQAINGKYGGTDVSKGINLPSNINVASHAGLRVNSTNSLCGFVVDTTFNTNATVGDTAKTFFGNFHFVYTCSTSIPDGYTVHDSLTNTENGTKFNNTFTVAQDYAVNTLDQTYKKVSMNGTTFSSIFDRVLATGGATSEYHYLGTNYKLIDLVVDFTSGVSDITSGTATFTTTKNDLDPTTAIDGSVSGFSGTFTFLGNHMVKVTYGSPAQTYLINLLTGQATLQ